MVAPNESRKVFGLDLSDTSLSSTILRYHLFPVAFTVVSEDRVIV